MFSLNDKRATNRGFGDGMSRAFEFAATPLLFGAAGFGLDTWFGTEPVLTIALATFAVVGMFVRLWYGYDAEMREIESTGAWSSNRTGSTDADGTAGDEAAGDLWARRRPATGRRNQ